MGGGDSAAPIAVAEKNPRWRSKQGGKPHEGDAQILELGVARQRRTVKQLLDGARTAPAAKDSLPAACAAAAAFPDDHLTRSYLLQIRERAGETTGISEAWDDLSRTHPDDRAILQFHIRRLVRDKRQDAARVVLDRALSEPVAADDDLLIRAELLDVMRAYNASDAAYRMLLARSNLTDARVSWAKRLLKRGLIEDAGVVLAPIADDVSGSPAVTELTADIQDLRQLLRNYENVEHLAGADFRILAMKHAVLAHVDRTTAEEDGRPLRIAMVTSSLGAGGAERQLARLAVELQARSTSAADVVGCVDVIVKEHDAGRGRDFFLPELRHAGVPVLQLNELQPVPAQRQGAVDPDLALLLKILPPQVHYGVVRLAPYLRKARPHVVSLWQDGTCLNGALAALLAGVPVIQLVFRGLPPNIRAERQKPEYEVLYKALAQVPGVEFISNSQAAAREYARWLGLPEERFSVVHNAVPMLDDSSALADRQKWEEFVGRTQDATETIGGVFRFESDKRPLVWLRMAARYLRRRPKARFVIVGSGRLLEEAQALVRKLRITRRVLFAGTSSNVGFWYAKMDVKVLLSRFEGLPNVLIEAQQMGTPVVSTPAGGAQECFVEGVTGHLLDCAERPCLDLACDRITALVDKRRQSAGALDRAARDVAGEFNMDRVMSHFLHLCDNARGAHAGEPA